MATCACTAPMDKAKQNTNKLPQKDLRDEGELGCCILFCCLGGAGKWRIYCSLACFRTPLIDPNFLTLSFLGCVWRTNALGQAGIDQMIAICQSSATQNTFNGVCQGAINLACFNLKSIFHNGGTMQQTLNRTRLEPKHASCRKPRFGFMEPLTAFA